MHCSAGEQVILGNGDGLTQKKFIIPNGKWSLVSSTFNPIHYVTRWDMFMDSCLLCDQKKFEIPVNLYFLFVCFFLSFFPGSHGHSHVEQYSCKTRQTTFCRWSHDISRRQSCKVPRNVSEGFGCAVRERRPIQLLEPVCSCTLQWLGHEDQRDLRHPEWGHPSSTGGPGQRWQLSHQWLDRKPGEAPEFRTQRTSSWSGENGKQ